MNDYNKSVEVLRDWGFYAENLWHIDAVKGDFTDAERMDILAKALNHPDVDKLIVSRIKSISDRK